MSVTDYPDYTLPVVVIGSVTVVGTVTVSGTVTISGTVEVSNIVSVTGTVAISGPVTVTGDVTVSGTVTITGTVIIASGEITVTALPDVTIGTWNAGTLTISGTVSVSSLPNVTIGTWTAGTLTVQGSVTVTSMPNVTIAVWNAGTLTVDGSVAVSSAPAITIGTWGAGTLDIKTPTGQHVDVDLISSITLTANVTVTSMPSVTIGTWTAGTLTVDGTVAVSSIPAVTIQTWNAGTLTVDGTVSVSSAPAITIDTWTAGTLTIAGSVTVTSIPNITIDTWNAGTLNVSITTSVALTIGTWNAGTLNIDIIGQTMGDVNVNITNATITVTGTVSISGTVTISGAVTVTGTVSITGSVTVTGSVTITSGAVTISTSGGTNIIIDQLIQGAYIERRGYLQNPDHSSTPPSTDTDAYRGKFFPRGCRGMLEWFWYWGDNTNAGQDATITFNIAPRIGDSPIISFTTAGFQGGQWRSIQIGKFWNYDSMYIWTTAMNLARVGYDSPAPNLCDGWISSDSGVTWVDAGYRYYFAVEMKAMTVGDLPVSGTINNIQIPSVAAAHFLTLNNNLGLTETTLKTINGSGTLVYIRFKVSAETNSHYTIMNIYCDGSLVWSENFASLGSSVYNYGSGTPGISLLQYGVNALCCVHITLPLQFRNQLKITAQAQTTSGQSIEMEGTANLLV